MAVFMCSGQGAQKVGMAADLLQYAEVAQTFALASDVLGVDLVRLVNEGTEEEINNTFNAQALTMATSVGVGKALMARGIKPTALVGFSLGQISALALSGALSEPDAFALLKVRAGAMADACAQTPGAMLALLGAEESEAQEMCNQAAQGDTLVLANYNCPGQIVASGTPEAISRLQVLAKESKKKCSLLKTAGAFHSPMMEPASVAVADFCQTLSFNKNSLPIICNTDAAVFDTDEAAQRLSAQVKSPVRFEQSIRTLMAQGEQTFIEVGFGGVLFNLLRRIDRDLNRYKAGTEKDFEAVVEALTVPEEPEARVALVTGASRGIGAAIATKFASQGYTVVINHSGEHSASAAADLAAQLSDKYGVKAKPYQANVANFDEVKQMSKDLKKEFGHIDVLVNNAGITKDGFLMRMKEADFDSVIDINLKGSFNCLRHFAPIMMKQRYGRIVNISSVVGVSGNPGQVNYGASKAGIIGMTKSAAKEIASRGVTVNAVAPGFITTDMTGALSEEQQDAIKTRIACGSFGTPEDVACAVAFLASEEAGYITGQVLGVDGGIS